MADLAHPLMLQETLRTAAAHAVAGRGAEALAHYEHALLSEPDNAEALSGVASLAAVFGEPERAVKHLRKAIARNRNVADYHVQLSNALMALMQPDEAEIAIRRALKLKPHNAEALSNLGYILLSRGDFTNAIGHLKRALSIDPNYALAHRNLGECLFRIGQVNDALNSFGRAVAHAPDAPDAYIEIVKCLNLLPDASPSLIADSTRRWARLLPRASGQPGSTNTLVQDRKLRIGYVSADFRQHAVGTFMKNVLSAHDHSAVEVFGYSNNKKDDDATQQFKDLVDAWRPIRGLTDAAAAALIRNDQIDILVDLSGHTEGHRLPVFAAKPAPIQCTWLGYYATTGLSEIDYIIADRIVLPFESEGLYVEKPWRLPDSYLCYATPEIEMPVCGLPVQRDGIITFGSCNNILKVNNRVVAVWSGLLQTVPNSRLLLRSPALSNPIVRDELRRRFMTTGIPADRLILLPNATHAELLATYNAIDIALDPFPYGGGTTTVEALWMGVPVVSLRGDRFSGRVSESILTAVGLPDLVVGDDVAYVAKAAGLAQDLPRLAHLRAGLRDQVVGSPLCDGPRFTRHLEAAYRGMWETWCKGKAVAA